MAGIGIGNGMGGIESEDSLSQLFYKSWKAYWLELNENEEEDLIDNFLKIGRAIETYEIFSPNEELEDINTVDLKYILTPFIIGHLYLLKKSRGEERLNNLQTCIRYWEVFLENVERLEIEVRPEDRRNWEDFVEKAKTSLSPEDSRSQKIERYRFLVQIKSEINYLCSKRQDPFLWNSIDDEDERELILKLVKLSVGQASDDIKSIQEEVMILKHMLKMSLEEIELNRLSRVDQLTKKPWSLTFQNKADLKAWYRENMLKPSHSLPTMTIEEACEMEMKMMQQPKSLETLSAVKTLQEEEAEEDAEALKTRNFDDYKDFHQKGWGNTKRNIG